MINNIEAVEMIFAIKEEMKQLCEPYVGAPNTKDEQEKMKQMVHRFLTEHAIDPINQTYIEVDVSL